MHDTPDQSTPARATLLPCTPYECLPTRGISPPPPGNTRCVPDMVCFPLAVAVSLLLTVAWLPLGLVATAARLLWTSVAARDTRPDGSGGGGGMYGRGGNGGGSDDPVGRVALARQRRAASAAKSNRVREAKHLKLVAVAPAVVLSSYLASWWRQEGSNVSGSDGRSGENSETAGDGYDVPSDGKREESTRSSPTPPPPQIQKEDPQCRLQKNPVVLAIAAEEGDSHATPPLTATSTKT